MSNVSRQKKEPDITELKEDFITQLNKLNSFNALQEFLNSLPSAAAILDSYRRVIFVNPYLLNSLHLNSFESVFGKKTGEILSCLHALENENQCGVSESCKVCGALQALKKTQATNTAAFSEMRLTAIQRGIITARDLKITVSPIVLNSHVYMIMFLNDISHEKRRKALERIFFHDILNKVTSLKGLLDIIKPDFKKTKFSELYSTAKLIIDDMTSEIVAQHQLVAAENGELEVNLSIIELSELIHRVVSQAELYIGLSGIKIEVEMEDERIKIISDSMLLNRIITNMVKNAIEASNNNDTVTIKTSSSENTITIAVHNKSYIPEEVQLQIFHRSFSTKGEDRGLGTYSIKLLTEHYLKGKVYFQSSEKTGTTFYIKIPVQYKKSVS